MPGGCRVPRPRTERRSGTHQRARRSKVPISHGLRVPGRMREKMGNVRRRHYYSVGRHDGRGRCVDRSRRRLGRPVRRPRAVHGHSDLDARQSRLIELAPNSGGYHGRGRRIGRGRNRCRSIGIHRHRPPVQDRGARDRRGDGAGARSCLRAVTRAPARHSKLRIAMLADTARRYAELTPARFRIGKLEAATHKTDIALRETRLAAVC